MGDARCRLVVLISGSGSNLQAIIDACSDGTLPCEIGCVISNRADAMGLERARQAGIPAHCVRHGEFATREAFDAALQACIDEYAPELVVLAGFMRILTPGFVRHYTGRLLNIHPSLLPKYPGLNTHQRAIEAADSEHGATVHFVTEDLDGGPAVVQARLRVLPTDTAESLAARVLELEHRIYPHAIRLYADGRLRLAHGHALLDGRALPPEGLQFHG